MEHNDLLDDKDEDKIILEIVQWWEKKRLQYNLIVGVIGVLAVSWIFSRVGGPVDSFVILYIIFCYGVMANIAYLLGWVLEILLKYYFNFTISQTTRFVLYGLGVFLSILPILAILTAFIFSNF